jgi:hypothetical protein
MLQNQRIIVVGRYPGLERYANELDITVPERQTGSGDLPDPACEFLLPEADWVFLTASLIPNKTFPRLTELAKKFQAGIDGADRAMAAGIIRLRGGLPCRDTNRTTRKIAPNHCRWRRHPDF